MASGAITVGPGVRPGRGAANVDGTHVAFMRDVNDDTANIVAGPIAGPYALIGSMNARDDTCWRNADVASAGGTTSPHLFANFCAVGATTFVLRDYAAADGGTSDLSTSTASVDYGRDRVVWSETNGALRSASADGSGAVNLAAGVADHVLSRDQGSVVMRTSAGAIASVPADGGVVLTAA